MRNTCGIFPDPLKVEIAPDGRHYTLLANFRYQDEDCNYLIPESFKSDGATSWRVIWWLVPAWGSKDSRGYILHDWLCVQANKLWDLGKKTEARNLRAHADTKLAEIYRCNGHSLMYTKVVYTALRAFAIWRYL